MAFGIFKNKKGPHEIVCPSCQNRQEEPPLAVSTFCKKCNAHLKIEDGVAQTRDLPNPNIRTKEPEPENPANIKKPPQPQPNQKTTPPPPSNTEKEALSPPSTTVLRKKSKLPPRPVPPLLQEQQTQANPEALKKKRKLPTPPPVKTQALAQPPAEKKSATPAKDEVPFVPREAGPDDRIVRCFECKIEHPTPKVATSAQCPKCGSYISLKDFDIKDAFNSRIQTRGTVVIQKKGIVTSSIIQCHDLLVEGEFTGAADCSGDLTIRRHSRIEGDVNCRHLRIEKRAKVEFLKGAKVESCEIDGEVTGNINCKGRLALHKKATLHGDIKVSSLSIDAGAKHHGQISMG